MIDFEIIIEELYEKFKNASIKQSRLLRYDSLVVEHIKKIKKLSLPILSVMPFDLLSESIKSSPTLDKYVLDDSEETDKVRISLKHYKQDTCTETLWGFKEIFDEKSEDYGEFTRVYVKGEMIGVVKHLGNPIFMAMLTKNNQIEAYPLITGGLYSLSSTLTKRCNTKKKFGIVSLDRVTVNPMKMLYKRRNHQHRYSREILPEIYEKIKE